MSNIPQSVRDRVRDQAKNCCGYCRVKQQYLNYTLEIDHIKPKAKDGTDDEYNLWLACRACNVYKGEQTHGFDDVTNALVPLFNPRLQNWHEHFRWSSDGTLVEGLTPCGRVTVEVLQLNNKWSIDARHNWVSVGWHPPKD